MFIEIPIAPSLVFLKTLSAAVLILLILSTSVYIHFFSDFIYFLYFFIIFHRNRYMQKWRSLRNNCVIMKDNSSALTFEIFMQQTPNFRKYFSYISNKWWMSGKVGCFLRPLSLFLWYSLNLCVICSVYSLIKTP